MEMGEWIKVLLSLSLSGTLLFLVLLALKRLYKKRVSKCWQYYILLAVALRFLVPLSSDTTIVGFLFGAVQNTIENVSVSAVAEREHTNVGMATGGATNTSGAVMTDLQTASNSNSMVSGGSALRSAIDFWSYGFFIWFSVALAFFIRKVTMYQSFLRYLKAGNQEVSALETLNILSDCEEMQHIGRTVELYQNPLVASPILVGFFRPRIILPARTAGERELSYIFTHELTHLKRWDIVYKWIVQMAVCVHWFNPFVYLLERETARACELSCDEAVIHALDDTEKKAYGDMLLLFMQGKESYKNTLASVTLTEGAKHLKERLGAIMGFHKKSKAATAATVALTVLICVCFRTFGVYAMQDTARGAVQPAAAQITGTDKYDSLLYDEDENAYYILYDGAQMIDMPDCSFSDGTIGIVLVREDGYTALGPFSTNQNLVAQVKRQLDDGAAKGHYTQRDMEIALKAAGEIEVSDSLLQEKTNKAGEYTYVQSGYYQKPFMIVLAYSTSVRNMRNFMMDWGEDPNTAYQKQVTHDDWKMTVYFTQEAQQLCQEHQEAYSAVGMLIHQLNTRDTDTQVKTALVRRIDYVEEDRVADYVQECYEKEDIMGFSAVFCALGETAKVEYYDKIYRAEQTAFFSVAADEMNAEQIALYADKAYQDDKVAFFAILCDRMDAGQRRTYVQRSYVQGDIAKFSILIPDLTREEQEEWLLRAKNDKKVSFASVLSGELDDSDEFDDFDAFDAFEVFDF